MIKEALTKYAESKDKQFKHDRSTTVGASEVGQCARKTFFTKRNLFAARGDTKKVKAPKEFDEDVDYEGGWGAGLRGTIIEDYFWYPAMKKRFGKKLLYAGKEQRTFAKGHLSATPDSVITDLPRDVLKDLGVPDIEGDCIVADSKSIDPRVNLRKAKEENELQIQVQLGLVRELTNYQPMYGLLSYVNASFWDDVKEYAVRFDETKYKAMQARADRIMQAKRFDEFPPEGWITGGKECNHCPFADQCKVHRTRVPSGKHADKALAELITPLAAAARAAKDQQVASEKAYKTSVEAIKEILRKKGTRLVPGVVTWAGRKGSASWDLDGLRAAALERGFDIDDFRTEGEPTDNFRVLLK